ncbi:MAG: hypothetical protein ACKO4M_09980 [Betaproteobacteria bacterium]
MTLTHLHQNPRRALTVALLVLSMLLAQWVGLTHAIAHSGVATAQTASSSFGEPLEHTKSASHCAVFDAATLGAGVASSDVPCITVVQHTAAVQLLIKSGLSRQPTHHFQSRAPPQLA